MSATRFFRSALWRDLVPLAAGIGLSCALLFIVVQERALVRAGQQAELEVTAEQTAARLAIWLEHRLASVEQFASQLATSGDPERFAIDALALFDRSPGFRAFNLVDRQGVIRAVVPAAANAPALGRDLTRHPAATVREAVRMALEHQRPTRSRYFAFIQGGSGFAVYWPVVAADGRTTAVVNAVIAYDEMLASAVPGERLAALYRVSVFEDEGASAADRTEPGFFEVGPPLRMVGQVPFLDQPLRIVIEPREPGSILAFGSVWWLLNAVSIALGLALSALLWIASRRRRAIERQDAQIRLLMDSRTEGVLGVDLDGLCTFANAAATRLLGRDGVEALVGEAALDWLEHAPDATTREGTALSLAAAVRGGHDWSHPGARARRADGSRFDAACRVHPVTERGVLTGALLTFSDVTAEISEAERTGRLMAVLQEVPDGVMLSDAAGVIEYVNPAGRALLGLDEAALHSYRAQDLVSEEQLEWLTTTVTRQVEQDGIWQGAVDARALDGTQIPARLVVMRHEDHRGTVYYSTLLHDLRAERKAETEWRALEVRFHQAQRLESLGVLAGGVAHDFNNMLVSILGNASLALDLLPADSRVRVLIERLELGAQRAAELTGQLLAYSGRGRFEPQATNAGQLVGEMVDLLRGSLEPRVQLQFVVASPCIVTADPTQIRQLTMNLITNAADAMVDGGVVQARVAQVRCDVATLEGHLFGTSVDDCGGERDWVQLEVIDTGVGMSDAVIAQIFDPFFSTREQGKGLGLAAVLGIVRGHGACMVVESTPGVGTRFRVLLPPAEQGIAAPAVPAMRISGVLSGTALLVDDEASVREYLKSALETLGFDVIDVADGQAGIDVFAARHGELVLVIIDQSMPGLSGTAAWAQMHALDPTVPGVLVSGYDEERIDRSVADLGLAGFLQKPFGFAALRSTVQRALGVEADG